MPDTIKIQTTDNRFISAVHQKPKESGLEEMERKLILMIHGFPGHKMAHSNLYGELEFLLIDKGFHTLRFDFTGCGDSDGQEPDFSLKTVADDLNTIKKWANDEGYKEFVYVSEGLGTIFALLNMEINVTCQVMLWPGLNPQYLAKHLFKSDTISEQERETGYVACENHRVGIPFVDELLKVNLANYFRDITMPTLILHGSADERFPIEHLNAIRKNATSKRIEITTFHDAEHGLPQLKHRKSMFFHIMQFLEKFA